MKKWLFMALLVVLMTKTTTTHAIAELPNNLFVNAEIVNAYSDYYIAVTDDIERDISIDRYSVYLPLSSYYEFENGGLDSVIEFYDDDGTLKDTIYFINIMTDIGGWFSFEDSAESYDYFNIKIATNLNSYSTSLYNGLNDEMWVSDYSDLFGIQQAYNDAYQTGYNDGLVDGGDIKESVIESQFGILTDSNDDGLDDKAFNDGYSNGLADGLDESEIDGLGWIRALFNLFDMIFEIELLPNISIGLILGVVLVPPLALKIYGWLT